MELWSCESCGSKNAGEVCWKCGATRPATAATPPSPPTPAPPSTSAEPAGAWSWDPSTAVPQKPATPSWSEPITVAAASPSESQAPEAPPPTPALAAYAPPQVSEVPAAADSWSGPESPAAAAVPSAAPPSAAPPPAAPPPPPPPAPPAATSMPTVRILLAVGGIIIVLVIVLIIVLSGRAQALTTPSSIEGLPQIHGASVDALAQQARQNAGSDGQGMLVGVYGRDQIPAFIFVVFQSPGDGLGNFEKVFIRGASQAGFSPGAFQHRSRDGVQYDCGTVQVTAGVPLSFCFFDDGRSTGAGLVPAEPGIDRALQLTASGRGAAESG
jgi:hypothetical protein